MSREFYSEQNMQVRAGDALKDPLVINFSGTAAQLGQRDFYFDIDADGSKDQIAFVGEGSGLLALDKNEDGSIRITSYNVCYTKLLRAARCTGLPMSALNRSAAMS